ncbi:MAG: TetR/AcrR family transcriptional regulator [Pseudomonadota bacterium]
MKRGYHHGNLRQALVDATLALIADKGPQGFTVSEAAKVADVTPAAVYRHFSGRDDLLAEVARQGFDIFAALMEYAYDNGRPSPLAAFEATGRAYLAFAQKYPGHYKAMFESGLSPADHPDLAHVAAKARGVLERAAEALSLQLPPGRRPPATMFSAHIWAMSHGVVELFTRGNGGNTQFRPEELLEAGIGIYLRGLGLLAADR